jgi:Domain of unknown function (DUF4328)
MTANSAVGKNGLWVRRAVALYVLILGLESLACLVVIAATWGVGDEGLSSAKLGVTGYSFIAMGLCGFAQVGVFILTVILFLRLLYTAVKQAQGFATPFTYVSAGWAVGYWFVPLMNLYRPLDVMKHLFKAYAAQAGAEAKPKAGEQLLSAWWAFWILGNIVSWIFVRADLDISNAPGMLSYAEFDIGVNLLLVASAGLFALVVQRLDDAMADAGGISKPLAA